jgi:hypothetical protein
MKKSISLVAILFASFQNFAQLALPQLSPNASISQKVGLTTITIDYSRPQVKGRVIFGEVVLFDKMWRAGANGLTTITVSKDIELEGKKLSSGKYALILVPSKIKPWTLIINKDFSKSGSLSNYTDSTDIFRVNIAPISNSILTEILTYEFTKFTYESVTLNISWEKTTLPIKIKVLDKDEQLKNIEKVLAGNPTDMEYFQIAAYHWNFTKNYDQALALLNKAIEKKADNYLLHWLKARVLGAKGNFEEALKELNFTEQYAKTAKALEGLQRDLNLAKTAFKSQKAYLF